MSQKVKLSLLTYIRHSDITFIRAMMESANYLLLNHAIDLNRSGIYTGFKIATFILYPSFDDLTQTEIFML
ncbi:MAG: hypothetical protein BGO67_00575 [Alphaproteobacteria bacterium 41-28]|nr:MAG: hypothetical protein BGO67_00575 [Alphaproteobacteria bacterium 41-28]